MKDIFVKDITGFRPDDVLLAWRVPKGATYRLVRLEGRDLCVEQKDLVGGDETPLIHEIKDIY